MKSMARYYTLITVIVHCAGANMVLLLPPMPISSLRILTGYGLKRINRSF